VAENGADQVAYPELISRARCLILVDWLRRPRAREWVMFRKEAIVMLLLPVAVLALAFLAALVGPHLVR